MRVYEESGIAGLKASPAAAVLVADATHAITLNDGVMALTIVYLVLQIAHLVWKWRKERAGSRKAADQ